MSRLSPKLTAGGVAALVAAVACLLAVAAWVREKRLPRPDHVVVVIEENKSFRQIVGNPRAPFINRLAGEGALFTNSYAITHPSQPNYLALFAGSTFGVEDECPLSVSGPNLASLLEQEGFSFAIYSESMPFAGYEGCGMDGSYARRHNPAASFGGRFASAAVNKAFASFPADYSKLPTVAFVVPDQANDMHDGDAEAAIEKGDAWLLANLGRYLDWARRNNALLILTWDEDDYSEGNNNRIATIFIGPMIRRGLYSQRIDHYDVLRTILDLYGLPPIGAAKTARPIAGIWQE